VRLGMRVGVPGVRANRGPVSGRRRFGACPWPQRNGGWHCCQPPLRRAKDLPVFVTWSHENPKAPMNPLSILAHQLRRRFPSGIPLFREARLTYPTTWPEGSLVVRSAWPGRDRNPNQNHPTFRGPSWGNHSCVPLRSPKVRRLPGTASRERQFPLPAPLTSWLQFEPEGSHHCLPAEIGPLVTCRTLLVLADLPRRPGPPSRSLGHHAHRFRVAEAKFSVTSLWITGISGATVGTLSKIRNCPA